MSDQLSNTIILKNSPNKNVYNENLQNLNPFIMSEINYSNMEEFEFKIILLGDVAVGKTSLINKFVFNKFQNSYNATMGIEFKSKELYIDSTCYAKLKIWDTCGQERFRAITRQYFKNTNGVLLVFDLSNRQTLHKLNSWLEDIRNNLDENSVIFLVGNKCDLTERDVGIAEQGKMFAKKNDLVYHEVSAKNGTGIVNLFEQISKKLVKNIKDKRNKKKSNKDLDNAFKIDNYGRSNRGKVEKTKRGCC